VRSLLVLFGSGRWWLAGEGFLWSSGVEKKKDGGSFLVAGWVGEEECDFCNESCWSETEKKEMGWALSCCSLLKLVACGGDLVVQRQ